VIRPAGRLLFAVALLLSGFASAQTPEQIFMRGNAAYEQGDYAAAAEAYRTVLQYRIRDPRVEFNLGNAEFRLGHLGEDILDFESSVMMYPYDM
jgi:tetratricopeptide (TPR) repeat protein